MGVSKANNNPKHLNKLSVCCFPYICGFHHYHSLMILHGGGMEKKLMGGY